MKPTFTIKVDQTHELAVYTKGNPTNPAVVFLHGGPGGRITEQAFDFFDLEKWYVIAFDQRGCGKSIPFASLQDNTPDAGVYDMEKIREHLNIESWHVFGGSYGSTLALLYAIKHPVRVKGLILRGIFLGRQEDIDWLYQEGASYFYPVEHEHFKTVIPFEKQENLIDAYYDIFLNASDEEKMHAAKVWADWEGSLVNLVPVKNEAEITQADISLATLECHFFANKMFWEDDNYILNNIEVIKDIPTHIVHGRYDVDCRPIAAFELYNELDNANLHIVESSGHNPFERYMKQKLISIMNKL